MKSEMSKEQWYSDEKKAHMAARKLVEKCRKWQEKLKPVIINDQITIMVKPGINEKEARERFLKKYKGLI